MDLSMYKQRYYASLIILGAGFLLARTIIMICQGAFDIMVRWVFILLIVELLIDSGCIITAIPWWIKNNKEKDKIPLRFGAAVVFIHATRVLIFVLGRTGPWIDFDVQPDQRAIHFTRWTWGEVYFTAIMATLSIICVILIWNFRRKRKNLS